MSTNWSEFQNDVQNVLNSNDPVTPTPPMPTPTPTPMPVHIKPNIWFVALLVLAVSLGIVIIFSNSKTELNTNMLKQQPPTVEVPKVDPPKVDDVQTLRQDVDSLKMRVKILGAVSNNNWSSSNQKDIVFIGKDWKMSQMPPNIQKTEADIKFLQDWVQ